MSRSPILESLLLKPLSILYRGVVGLRNSMFKWGILKQHEPPIPVVVIGNLAVGGTGKTPHVEMVVEMLRTRFKVAVLSRGYNRQTKGFVLASPRSTPTDIGDEPYQISHKFGGEIPVAVCESRVKGIEEINRLFPEVSLVILDDAFQHRYIKPTVSIVLTEFHRPAYEDAMLPLGHLREPFKSINRADIVIVTKCPAEIKPIDYRVKKEKLGLMPFQKLYFSSLRYQNLMPVFPESLRNRTTDLMLDRLTPKDSILALSGIANPRSFIKRLKMFPATVKSKSFPDHYNFQRRDLDIIKTLYGKLPGNGKKYIITTEKDAVRLANNPYYPVELKPVTFYQPITIRMHNLVDNPIPIATVIENKIRRHINKKFNTEQS